jgi:hypothetical protein
MTHAERQRKYREAQKRMIADLKRRLRKAGLSSGDETGKPRKRP